MKKPHQFQNQVLYMLLFPGGSNCNIFSSTEVDFPH